MKTQSRAGSEWIDSMGEERRGWKARHNFNGKKSIDQNGIQIVAKNI